MIAISVIVAASSRAGFQKARPLDHQRLKHEGVAGARLLICGNCAALLRPPSASSHRRAAPAYETRR